jgi:hypothetical protein
MARVATRGEAHARELVNSVPESCREMNQIQWQENR